MAFWLGLGVGIAVTLTVEAALVWWWLRLLRDPGRRTRHAHALHDRSADRLREWDG